MGELAALLAAFCFSMTSTLFTLAGRQLESSIVIRISLPLGAVCLAVIHWLINGEILPSGVSFQRWFWLSLSGITGFLVAFFALVKAFNLIGPRLALLVASLNPVLTTILAWFVFHETLDVQSIMGIILTVSGIIWVVSERKVNRDKHDPDQYRKGIMLALVASVGQSVTFLFSDQGVSGEFDPLTGSLMRILVAALVFWVITIMRGEARQSIRMISIYPGAIQKVLAGTILGPVFAATLLLVAVQLAPVGIASALANFAPIFLIPIGYFVFKEHISVRTVVGTVIAILGAALLLL